MPIYKAPVDDTMFLLTDVLQIARYNNLPGFADASPDLLQAILDEAAKLAEEVVQPLHKKYPAIDHPAIPQACRW